MRNLKLEQLFLCLKSLGLDVGLILSAQDRFKVEDTRGICFGRTHLPGLRTGERNHRTGHDGPGCIGDCASDGS